MRRIHVVVLGLFLAAGAAYAQPAPNQCQPGANCKAVSYTATKNTGSAVLLTGDAGVRFGDGTVQNTAATAFSGTATNYTATAAANAFAYKSNMGAQTCFTSDCAVFAQADGGMSGVSATFGLVHTARVADSANNAAFAFNALSNSGGAISSADLLTVRNNGVVRFTVQNDGSQVFGGNITVSGGYVLGAGAIIVQAGGNSGALLRSTRTAAAGQDEGVIIDNTGATMHSSTKPVSFKNGGTEYAYFLGDTTLTLGANLANQISIKGSATTSPVTITAAGSDTDIDIKLAPKGAGKVTSDKNVQVAGYVTTTSSGSALYAPNGYSESLGVYNHGWMQFDFDAAVADANYNNSTFKYMVRYTSISTPRTVTPPSCSKGVEFVVKCSVDCTTNTVTVTGGDSGSDYVINRNKGAARFWCDGTNWQVIGVY